MHDLQMIAELEGRIARALDRIGQGLARLPDATPQPGAEAAVSEADVAALHEALETERGAVAQLNERLRTVKEREAAARAALEGKVAELTAALERLQDERRGESAEMQDILAALVPLIEEPAAHA